MQLLKLFSNPWVGVVGTLSSVIAIPLALVLYLNSIKERDLTYSVYPLRTTVLQSGYAGGLRVLHNNEEIKTDITAVQLAIWNNGKEPILRGDILSPVKIVTRPPVSILEVRVQKQSRPLIEFSTDNSLLEKGVVPLSWKLLEQSDGAAIQLLYVGPTQIDIALEGIVLGQSNFTRVDPELTNNSMPSVKSKEGSLAGGVIVLVLGAVMLLTLLHLMSQLLYLQLGSTALCPRPFTL